jgi:hypothetical protein
MAFLHYSCPLMKMCLAYRSAALLNVTILTIIIKQNDYEVLPANPLALLPADTRAGHQTYPTATLTPCRPYTHYKTPLPPIHQKETQNLSQLSQGRLP